MPQRRRTFLAAKFWAVAFLSLSAIAMACIPARILVDIFDGPRGAVRVAGFSSCTLSTMSALTYLVLSYRRRNAAEPGELAVRILAFLAIVITGGYVLLVVVLGPSMTFGPCGP